MALEIARLLPQTARVLDVGCGNGFIAHHLNAMLDTKVLGLDVAQTAAAAIDYRHFDGRHFPVRDKSIDAVLLCYVLHHAQDAQLVLNEVSRVLIAGGFALIYEDIPRSRFDQAVCWLHNRRWRNRTGPCTFLIDRDWREIFETTGFEVVTERPLSRWRNLAHPVSRQFFVLRSNEERNRIRRRSKMSSGAVMISEERFVRT